MGLIGKTPPERSSLLSTDLNLAELVLIWKNSKFYQMDLENLFTAIINSADQYIPRRGYIDGLICSNATDTEHDISIAAGIARDSTDLYTLELSSAMVKQIDASWAAGSDAGGLDTGTVAASTPYYIFLIRKDSDGSIDALFSLSATAPTMPTGYTYFRRIMSIRTDSSANVLPFDQYNDEVILRTVITDRALAAFADTNRNSQSVSCPPNMQSIINFEAIKNTTAAATYAWIGNENRVDAAASASNHDIYINAATSPNNIQKKVMVDSDSNVYIRGSGTAASWQLTTLGWIDDRGKNN